MLNFLTTLPTEDVSGIVPDVQINAQSLLSGSNMWISIIVVIAIIVLVIGLIKKALWMCIVAFVAAAFLGITSPTQVKDFANSIITTVNQAIDPLKDSDYKDIIGDDIFNNPNRDFEDIGQEPKSSEDSENSDK